MNPAWRFLLPIFGVWLLLYGSYALSRPPLPDGPATVHAEIAREMLARHDWRNAYVNGVPAKSFSRPLEWSIAASFKLFGVWDWSARLPTAVCVLLLALTVYFLGRTLFGWNAAGLYAALIVLSWPGTFLASRDLTDVPFLYFEAAIAAWILWRLLVVRQIATAWAVAVSVLAAGVISLAESWPRSALPLSILLTCWICRLFVAPDEKRRRFLTSWLGLAWVLSMLWIYPEASPRGALLWLAVIAPLGLIVGGWLANKEAFSNPAPARRVARYAFVIGLIAAAVAAALAIHGPVGFNVPQNKFAVHSLSGRLPLLISALAIMVGVSGNMLFRLRDRARIANCFLLGILGGIIVAIQVGLVRNSPYSSSQILAEAIRPELNRSDIVVIDGNYSDASSLSFYLERPIATAASEANERDSAPQATVAINQVWSGPSRVFLWTRTAAPLAVPGESFTVARSGDKEIVSNRPNSGGASF